MFNYQKTLILLLETRKKFSIVYYLETDKQIEKTN